MFENEVYVAYKMWQVALDNEIMFVPTDDDDKINLRDIFERAAVHYAVSEYWASRGDAKEGVVHYKRYLKLLGLYDDTPSLNERIFQNKTQKVTTEVRG